MTKRIEKEERDRRTSSTRRQSYRRLYPHQIIPLARAHNRPIRLAPQRRRRQPDRTPNPAPSTRATRIRIREIRTRRLAAAARKPRGDVPTEVGPLAQVRFSEEDRACAAESCGDARVAGDDGAEEGEGPGGGVHPVAGERGDVVFEEDRDPVESAAWAFGAPFGVEFGGLCECAWIGFDDGAESRPLEVYFFDAREVCLVFFKCASIW